MFPRILIVLGISVSSFAADAASLPRGFAPTPFNGSGQPTLKDGITTLQIFDQQCSKKTYGDDRGEGDCDNGNVRSSMFYSPHAKVGQTWE